MNRQIGIIVLGMKHRELIKFCSSPLFNSGWE